MSNKSQIQVDKDDIENLVEICAGLVREGVLFKTFLREDVWVIEFTGGY
jgi:hypothetical protein